MSDNEQLLRIIAENLKGTLEHSMGSDSMGNEWKKYTIVYGHTNKKDLDKSVQLFYNVGSFSMAMNLQVVQLVTGDHVVADVEQLEEEPNCYLKDPYLIKDDGSLVEWPLYSSERGALIYSNRIVTISEPNSEIVKKIPK